MQDSQKREVSRGEFRYSADAIEFVEFNLEWKIPAFYELVTFRDGLSTSYQRLSLNSGGMIPPRWRNLDRSALPGQFQSSPLNYYLSVEAYDVANVRQWFDKLDNLDGELIKKSSRQQPATPRRKVFD